MTTRRAFMASLLAAGTAPHMGWAAAGNSAFLAAAKERDDSFALYGLDTEGRATFRIPCPLADMLARAIPTGPRQSHLPAVPAPLRW